MRQFTTWQERALHVARGAEGRKYQVEVHVECGAQVQTETGVDGGHCPDCRRWVYDLTHIEAAATGSEAARAREAA